MAQIHAIEPKTFSFPDENETLISRSFPLVSIITELLQFQRQEYRFIKQQKKKNYFKKKRMKEALVSLYRKGAYFGEVQYFREGGPVNTYQTREVKQMTECSFSQIEN